MSSTRTLCILLLMTCLCKGESASALDDYTADLQIWKSQRVERLTAADGWLTLVALHWLKPGINSVGSDTKNDCLIESAPKKLGTFELQADSSVLFKSTGQAPVLVDGQPKDQAVLAPDTSEKPSLLKSGNLSVRVIVRGERIGLRIKDSAAPARQHFKGLTYFPADPSWRIVATWVPFVPAKTIRVTNVLGQVAEEKAPGKAVFERDGHTYELIPTQEEPDGDLFFVLRDLTSGKETYGASRFLDAKPAVNGKVLLDFNKAYNPPCAFTSFATCPLPIPENRLPLAITAGEKTYEGHE